jgi:hypothetical protein
MIFIFSINYGYDAESFGNLLAIPTCLDQFGPALPKGGIEMSAHDWHVLNAAFTCGLFLVSFAAGLSQISSDENGHNSHNWYLCTRVLHVSHDAFARKFFNTLGFGLGHNVAPVYVAEIAPDKIRGVCLTLVVSNSLEA